MATNSYGWVANASNQGQQAQMQAQRQQMQNDYQRRAQQSGQLDQRAIQADPAGYSAWQRQAAANGYNYNGQGQQQQGSRMGAASTAISPSAGGTVGGGTQNYMSNQQNRPPTYGYGNGVGDMTSQPQQPQRRDYGAPPSFNTSQGQRFNYQPPTNNGPNPFNPGEGFGEIKGFSPFMGKDFREAANSYSDNYVQPMLNYQLQRGDQDFNQRYTGANFNEQVRLNDFNMGMQNQANWRENTGLQFSMDKYQQDFGELQRQFNQGMQLSNNQLNQLRNYQSGQLQNEAFNNQTGRLNAQNQFTLGQGQLQNESFNNQTQRQNVQNQYQLGMGQNANQRYGIDTGYRTAQMENATTQRGQQLNYQLGQGQNDIQRQSVQNQFTLGQGQLGLGNRELDLNNQYRYKALSQEDALTRQRLANEMTQSRYAAFGRAQAPNFRALNSWQ